MPAKKPTHPVLKALPKACGDEAAAVEFFEAQRWGDNPACPRCGDVDVYMMQSKDGGRNEHFRWRCRGCKKMYTVRTGTVMEETSIPLRKWAHAMWLMASAKKGVSSMQLSRTLDVSYKSALFLSHRIRWAMVESGGAPLVGTVEVDETYVGGRPRKSGRKEDRKPAKRGRGTKKQPVVAMVERQGRVRTQVVADVTAKTLRAALDDCVDRSACIVTDEFASYPAATRDYADHRSVGHGSGEYARTDPDGLRVHSNTAESFFSLFKRSLVGSFHHVSKEHLHRYATEREFHWNSRDLEDGDRMAMLVRFSEGKRLLYSDPRKQVEAEAARLPKRG